MNDGPDRTDLRIRRGHQRRGLLWRVVVLAIVLAGIFALPRLLERLG